MCYRLFFEVKMFLIYLSYQAESIGVTLFLIGFFVVFGWCNPYTSDGKKRRPRFLMAIGLFLMSIGVLFPKNETVKTLIDFRYGAYYCGKLTNE